MEDFKSVATRGKPKVIDPSQETPMRKEPWTAPKPNKFNDDGRSFQRDAKFDKRFPITREVEPRDPHEKIAMICSVCKTETVVNTIELALYMRNSDFDPDSPRRERQPTAFVCADCIAEKAPKGDILEG